MLQPEAALTRLPVLWQVQKERGQFVKVRPRSTLGSAPSSHRHGTHTLTRPHRCRFANRAHRQVRLRFLVVVACGLHAPSGTVQFLRRRNRSGSCANPAHELPYTSSARRGRGWPTRTAPRLRPHWPRRCMQLVHTLCRPDTELDRGRGQWESTQTRVSQEGQNPELLQGLLSCLI